MYETFLQEAFNNLLAWLWKKVQAHDLTQKELIHSPRPSKFSNVASTHTYFLLTCQKGIKAKRSPLIKLNHKLRQVQCIQWPDYSCKLNLDTCIELRKNWKLIFPHCTEELYKESSYLGKWGFRELVCCKTEKKNFKKR